MLLSEKALDLLELADMKIGSPERWQRRCELAIKYSGKAINKKMDELVERGYVECLKTGTAAGNLTTKGRTALERHGRR